MQKEIWQVPCNYTGFLTVYFRGDSIDLDGHPGERIYTFDDKGVCISAYGKNDGFTKDLNETIKVRMSCDNKIINLPYYINSVLDSVSSKYFATNLIVGKKDGVNYKSLLIIKR